MNAFDHNQKMQAAQERISGLAGSDTCCNQAQAMGVNPEYRRQTLCEEAEKRASRHNEEAQKAASAAAFLRDHPEFDEFIRLIRSGAIEI